MKKSIVLALIAVLLLGCNSSNERVLTTATGSIYEGFLEQSNVSVVDEMVQMIAVQRNYDTNQRMITTIDDTLDIAVNQLGRLS